MRNAVSRPALAGFLLLLAMLLAEGFYAVRLNAEFYQRHIPFYDSCAYTNQLAEIFAVTRARGALAGIESSIRNRNVALPWLEAVALARFTEPSRYMAVWLQWIWLAVLGISVYWYFTRYRGADPLLGVCLTLPFVSFESVYHWAGGLPDFRMDLSLYIFVALFGVWYLMTYESESRWPWLLCGIAGLLACLGRATGPVYLAVMFLPVLIVRFCRPTREGKRLLFSRLLWMAGPLAVAVALLLYNFDFLHQYYVEWSPDANRGLPVTQSALHLIVGPAHIGVVLALASLAVLGLSARAWYRGGRPPLDWKLVYLGAAPGLFLTLRGAGLNPYVSMPAVFGCLMFAYFPARGKNLLPSSARGRALVCILLAGACLHTAATAHQSRPLRGINVTRMDALQTLADRMIADASRRGLRQVAYIIPEIGEFHSCALSNTLIYEHGGVPADGEVWLPSGVGFYFPQEGAFTASDPYLWAHNVPGATDEQKMAALVSMGTRLPQYLFLPTERGLSFLEQGRTYNLINLKTRELKRRLLATGQWAPLGAPADITPQEQIQLYGRAR